MRAYPALTARMTEEGWRDNVVRREMLEAAHPDLDISYTDHGWTYTATWDGADGKRRTYRSTDLGQLLDHVEPVLAERTRTT